ncbi:MAG: formate dehydrogenase subunit delta [Xanthobacteraceae bacterium]
MLPATPPAETHGEAHAKSIDKLIYMANQIGQFFASQGPAAVVSGTAEHIRKFWDPRMRAQIFAHLKDGGAGLDPAVRAALQTLQGPPGNS